MTKRTRPVLFVDFDGVLNCASTDRVWRGFKGLDPTKVRMLDAIVEQTGARIVISSAWRVGRSVEDLRRILKLHTMRHAGAVIGKTRNGRLDEWREGQIKEWLAQHPKVKTFAIVDDTHEFPTLFRRYVQTTWESGLEPGHVRRLVALLRGAKTGGEAGGPPRYPEYLYFDDDERLVAV